MSHCRACDAPIKFSYRSPEETDGVENVVEDLCSRCIMKSHVDMPQGYYDGLWRDIEAPGWTIVVPPEDYLI